MKKDERKRIVYTGLILGIASFFFFQFFYAYHLFFREQMQLFLFSTDYLNSYFNKPAWLACLAGDFFTQFFYFRGGGALVISVVFTLEYFLVARVLRQISRTNYYQLWAILPVAIDWVLQLKLASGLASSFGLIICLLIFQLDTLFSKPKVAFLLLGLLLAFATYWLAGSAAFIFPLLVLLAEPKQAETRTAQWKLLLLLNWFSPYLFRTIYLLPIRELYFSPGTQLQWLALPLSLGAIVLFLRTAPKWQPKFRYDEAIFITLLLAAILTFGLVRNANFKLEKILSLDSETYFGNSNRVLDLASKYQLKNRYASYFANVALAQTNELPEKLLNYYQLGSMGLIIPVGPDESREAIVFSNEMFFLVGDMNLAQHSAMLGNTFSPFQRSSRMMKRLAEINLVIGDSLAAGKYLRLLSKTWFHRNWAETREKMDGTTATNGWLKYKQSLLPESDSIRKADDYLPSLRYLMEQKPENKTAVDYYLCSLLLNKDLKTFKTGYDDFVKPKHQPVPRIYAEALLIIIYQQQLSIDEAKSYGISPLKVNEFVKYNQLYESTNGAMEPLENEFDKSYWYYYQFAKLVSN